MWEYNCNNNLPHNINCGSLRRIGKTNCLLQIATEFKYARPDTHILIISNLDIDLYRELDFNIIRPQNLLDIFRGISNAIFFADEIPDAEIICRGCNLEFIAGFYSTSEHWLPELQCSICGRYNCSHLRPSYDYSRTRESRTREISRFPKFFETKSTVSNKLRFIFNHNRVE